MRQLSEPGLQAYVGSRRLGISPRLAERRGAEPKAAATKPLRKASSPLPTRGIRFGRCKTPIPPAGSPNPATMRLGSCPQSGWTRPNPPVPKDEGFPSTGSGERPWSWCEAGSGGLSLSITHVDARLGKAGGRAGATTAQLQPQHHEFGKALVSQDGLGWKGP